MADVQTFEHFATAEFRKMGLNRTNGRGVGRGRGELSDSGSQIQGTRIQTDQANTSRSGQQGPEIVPPRSTELRNGPVMGVSDDHATTSDDSAATDPLHQPLHSSVREPENATLVNAFRNILANENRDEALAQLFASLLVNRQPVQAAQPLPPVIPTYHVIPDLSRNIEYFTGDDDSVHAREWIENLEAMERLHEWPADYLFEAARMHLRGGAKDWIRDRSRELRTWQQFREEFRITFIIGDDTSTRWARMKARVQGKSETLTQYFHSKTRLCSALKLSYREIKAEVLMGLWSRELANIVLPSSQFTTTELLHDLLYYDKVIGGRVERIRSSRDLPAAKPRASSERASVNEPGSFTEANPVRRVTEKADAPRAPRDGPRKCFNCNKLGHLARDCPDPRRTVTCFKCGKEGHISRQCEAQSDSAVRTIGRPSDSTASKYLKIAIVNGREVSAFIDTGSSECTIRASRVLTEQFAMTPLKKDLKGFGPPQYVVTSPGVVMATVKIDGVEVPNIEMRVVPDDVQPMDAIIGRSFTEQPSVDYHKVGETLVFCRNSELPHGVEPTPSSSQVAHDVVLPPQMISFIDVVNGEDKFELPILNLGLHEKRLQQGHTNVLRGEVSRCQQRATPASEHPFISIEDIDIGPEQPDSVAADLCNVMNKYRDCVSTNLHDLGCATNVEMDIQVSEASKPVFSKPYRTSERERSEIRTILGEWREAGIITDTKSEYASPVLLVKKKNGESRLCVDFRKLNQQTKRVHFPLPNIDDHLSQLRDSSLFIVLDLAHGYLQIPLSKEAREKTAIITSEETAEFTRMVFGLMNGPAFFSKAMQRALGPLRNDVVLFYLDDVLIPGKSWEELKPKLIAVLEALRKAGLTLKLSKCKFLHAQVSYLGYEITDRGIEPGRQKLMAIKEFPAPQNVHEVRRYLGLTSYFRKFVPRFAHMAEPLHNLLKSNVKFIWGEAQQRAFETLKLKLIEPPVLQTFNPEAYTELHTDASAAGLGAMLLQKDASGQLRLVYALSRRTSDPETRYHSGKLELLAIVWAVARLRTMLANIEFTIVTDCQSLCYLNTKKTLNHQMVRWTNSLSEYSYNIVHRAGVRMAHVDALSRGPVESPDTSLNDFSVFTICNDEDAVRMYQFSDDELKTKKIILEKTASKRTKYEVGHVTGLELIDGVLYKRVGERLLYVVPAALRKSLVIRFHDLKSHPGVERTVTRLRESYYFPRMKSYIRRHIQACLHCIACKSKPGKQAGELHPIPPGHRPFAVIHMDHMGPFVTSARGNKYVFVIVDNLTKFAIVRAVRDVKIAGVLRILEEFVREYGAPLRVISDRGTSFTSKQFEQFCQKHGIKHTLNSPRHPQANGQVERWNATLLPAIQSSLVEDEGRTWDRRIRDIQTDVNEMRNASTSRSPFELVYGYIPRRSEGELRQFAIEDESTYTQPVDLQRAATERILSEQEKYKQRYDASRAKNVHFRVGDIVYMKTVPSATGESTKLHPKYRGPLVINKMYTGDTYHVSDLKDSTEGRRYASTAHASQLKLWKPDRIEIDDEDSSESDPDISVNDDSTATVSENVNVRASMAVNKNVGDSEVCGSAGKSSDEAMQLNTDARKSGRLRRPPNRYSDNVLA